MALHNSGIGVWRHDNSPWRARCHVSIRQSPSLCNAILNTCPCLIAIIHPAIFYTILCSLFCNGYIMSWWCYVNETIGPSYIVLMTQLQLSGAKPQRNINKVRTMCIWSGALIFSLIYVWIKGWANNREAGGLRRHRAHYDVTVMLDYFWSAYRSATLFDSWTLAKVQELAQMVAYICFITWSTNRYRIALHNSLIWMCVLHEPYHVRRMNKETHTINM